MRRRELIALLGGATVAMPWAVPVARAGSKHAADLLIGAWRFVSSINTRSDGSTFDRWGPDARGILMLDAEGHFAQIVMSSESRMFGAKTFFSFGSYSVEESSRELVTHIEGCSLAKLTGNIQRRLITLLTPDQFKYINPETASGSRAEVLWQRMKSA